jgi:hypothetical protein
VEEETMSISEAPIRAGSAHTDIAQAVKAYITTAKLVASGGLTWIEFGDLLVGLLRLAITGAELFDLPGPVKKEIVLEAVAALFDSVADYAVPTMLLPLWLAARPAVRSLVLSLASGAIEQLLPLLRAAA